MALFLNVVPGNSNKKLLNDLIEGRAEAVLELDIIDLIAVDSSGREIPVTVTDDNPTVTVILDENALVSTEEQLLAQQFTIYPNPVKDRLTINFDSLPKSEVTVEVYDLVGTVSHNKTYSNVSEKGIVIDFSEFRSNVYYVKITSGKDVTIKKVVLDK